MGIDANLRRTGRRWAGAAAVAVLVAGLFAACTSTRGAPADLSSSAASPASAVSSTPSASPSAALLSCDDLVPRTQIVQALAAGQPSDDWVVLPASRDAALSIGLITGDRAVEGAGGLACAWRAGPPNSETGEAVLSATILPGAADSWTGSLHGDAPTSDRRTFAGVSAAATCGDPGCGATAAVGSSWVRVDLITGSREGGESAFAKQTDDEVFAELTPAVESVFRAVQGADAAQLQFPNHLPTDGTPAGCRNYLGKVDLASALDVDDVRISTRYQPDPDLDSLFAAAELQLGTSVCSILSLDAGSALLADVTVAPGQAWAVDDAAETTADQGDFRPVQLEGAVSGERALSNCGASTNTCTLDFTLGSDAIEISDAAHPERVAEAIIAGAR